MRTPTTVTTLAAMWATSAAIAVAQDASIAPKPAIAGTCIAMSLPSIQGISGNATDVGIAVRDVFATYLRGPSIHILLLEARLAVQASEEARQKSCDRVLTVSLAQKRSGGGVLGRALGHAGSTAAWHTPATNIGTAIARGAAIATGQATAEIASTTRAKDEMRLEFKLSSPDGRILMKPKEEKAKASADGEDLVTPLVQRAAESIGAFVLRR